MGKLRISSPGMLLILAVTAAGGIYLLDLFFFEPHVSRQRAFALREQASRAESAARWAVRTEQDRLASLCGALAREGDLAARLRGEGIADDPPFSRRVASLRNVDAAWLTDANGHVVDVVSWWDDLKVSERKIRQSAADLVGPEGPAAERAGLADLGGEVVVFARCPVRAPDGPHETIGQVCLIRRLGGALLLELGRAVSASLVWVRAGELPENILADDSGQRATWPLSSDRLAVAWPAKTPAGKMLGYFRADFSMAQIQHQAAAARKTILVTLSLSGGAILLVILGASVFLANPIVRLMRRVRRVEAGEQIAEEFTRHLHAEPLALAKVLESAFQAMSELSKTDELTGLANRRQFEEVLERAFAEARRYQHPLSVLAMDIDLFKAINDTGGHQAGDELIKVVADRIRTCCRKADLPARFGGDEFAVLLPQTSAAAAAIVAERVRRAVAETTWLNGAEVHMTISIGIADLDSGRIDTPEGLMVLADRGLFGAKQNGRNRFVQANDLSEPAWEQAAQEADRVAALRERLGGLDTQFKALCVRALQEIVQALEGRDPHMADHARKVQHYAVLMARQMRLSEQVSKRIELAALLHDIGMLALPDSVALCPGRLDDDQIEAMKRHPLIGARVVEGMEFLEQVIPAIRAHHERYDGQGYPDGLAGPGVPLAARVVAVADAFDAMTSPRAFRGPRPIAEAVAEIGSAAGTQFDPDVVAAFLAVYHKHGERLLDVLRPGAAVGHQAGDAPPHARTVQSR
jgi:diguanylate cyclase (GGDEF)-like protein/putative nucleotidyltransferase with HDIG domain